MPQTVNLSFEGLTPEAAKELAGSISDAGSKRIEKILEDKKALAAMPLEDINKLEALAKEGNGGCFIGCSTSGAQK